MPLRAEARPKAKRGPNAPVPHRQTQIAAAKWGSIQRVITENWRRAAAGGRRRAIFVPVGRFFKLARAFVSRSVNQLSKNVVR